MLKILKDDTISKLIAKKKLLKDYIIGNPKMFRIFKILDPKKHTNKQELDMISLSNRNSSIV